MYNDVQSRTSGKGGILMVYGDRFCTDFGGQQKRKMCRSGKDIGRACNMSHAEQVAGEKVWSVTD